MKNLKFFIFLVLLLVVLSLSLVVGYKISLHPEFKILKINETKFFVEIADNPVKMAKGLSGYQSLPENQGMLFIFDKPDRHSFWMKKMFFALDFIWIRDGQIVEITEKVKPEDYQPPKVLTPKEKIDAVLEIKAGMVEKFKIKVGDAIIID